MQIYFKKVRLRSLKMSSSDDSIYNDKQSNGCYDLEDKIT